MRVCAFTGGKNVPSARLRVRQYIPRLREFGIEVRERRLWMGKMMPRKWAMRPLWAASTVLQRSVAVPCSYAADVTLISRQVMPAFIPYDRFTKAPRVLDVDDAIWLNRGGHRAGKLAQCCDAVICGNSFLAEFFSNWNRNVVVIPTAVDTELMRPGEESAAELVIGWTGTSDNFRYLYGIEGALRVVLEKHEHARLRVISDVRPVFQELDAARVEFVKWSEEAERAVLRTLAVGIMPLEDSAWARGKCSFKMLTYMASGVPVVASPVGMNAEVLGLGEIGFGAATRDEWIDALDVLLSEREEARAMGMRGREVAVRYFSVEALAPRLARELFSVAGRTNPVLDMKLA
jgi:glycosyltransferase involved in cell wall biosynthesis